MRHKREKHENSTCSYCNKFEYSYERSWKFHENKHDKIMGFFTHSVLCNICILYKYYVVN